MEKPKLRLDYSLSYKLDGAQFLLRRSIYKVQKKKKRKKKKIRS